MPTYQYRCLDCSNDLEVVQKFTDDALTVCPTCEGTLRKVFSPVGVVFKGSGFYATDSRAAKKSSTSSSSTKTDSKPSDAKAGDSKSTSTTSGGDKTPATTSNSSSSGAPAA